MSNIMVWGALCVLMVTLTGCSAAKKSFSTAQNLEAEGRYEEAMYQYAEAFQADPAEGEYRLRFFSMRQKAALAREQQGDALMKSARYAEAVTAYQTATSLDGSQGRFILKAEEAMRKRDAAQAWQEGQGFEKNNRLRDAALSYQRAYQLAPDQEEYDTAVQRLAKLRKSRLDGFELQLKSKQPITLRFRETRLKDIFNVVAQLSGINFVFDDDVKDQSVTIALEGATFQQATDLLAGMYKLGRKVLNETTMLIYPRTPDKIKQYEEMLVRTYHLQYLEAKKAAALIKSLVQVRKLHINDDGNSIVVRDTANVIAVVDKILEANDLPDPEVVLDVEIIEVNDKNSKDVGLLLSNYNVHLGAFTPDNNLLSPFLYPGSDSKTPVDSSHLLKAFSINTFGGYVTVPNATYNFGKTLAKGEVLSNPKLRVKHKEKAKFTVGQRVPIQTVTGNLTSSSSYSSNVQYVDVGIKMNAEPTIQVSNEVSVKLGLEVSQVINKETAKDGTTLLTIGTRNIDTVLSLKDGETVIIGGLLEHKDNDNKTKVFLLGDVPLLGPLFSNNSTSNEKSELLLAVTPRLVRQATVPVSTLTRFASGREDDPALTQPYASFDQEPEYAADPAIRHPSAVQQAAPQPAALTPSHPRSPQSPPVPGGGAPLPATQRRPQQLFKAAPSALPQPSMQAPVRVTPSPMQAVPPSLPVDEPEVTEPVESADSVIQ